MTFNKIMEYRTEYYKDPTLKALGLIFLYLVLISFFVYIARSIDSKIVILAFIFFLIATFIGMLVILKKKQIRTAYLIFDEEELTIKIYEIGTDNMLWQDKFLLNDITSYKLYFDSKKNTCLTIYSKNNKKSSFIFKDNKTYQQAKSEESVFLLFYKFVKNASSNNIVFRPSFLATKAGLYIICFEIFLLIMAFGIHLYKNSFSHAYYLILGVGLLIPQIVNRKQNKDMYDQITNNSNE